MSRPILISFVFLLTYGTLFSQTKQEKKELKAEKEAEQFKAAQELIASGTYDFSAIRAKTFKGTLIDLVTNPNYLQIDQGQAKIYLPYFGVGQNANAAYSQNGGIVFEGPVEDYDVTENEKKGQIKITFKCNAQKESLNFFLTVFGNGFSKLNVSSSSRTGISYDGATSTQEK